MAFDSSENPQRGPQSAQVSVLPLKVGRGRVGIPRNFRVLKEGENRTLDFLPQKTMTRLEVLRPVPCKCLETRLEKPVVVGMFRMPPSLKTPAVFSALSVKGCRVPNADLGRNIINSFAIKFNPIDPSLAPTYGRRRDRSRRDLLQMTASA